MARPDRRNRFGFYEPGPGQLYRLLHTPRPAAVTGKAPGPTVDVSEHPQKRSLWSLDARPRAAESLGWPYQAVSPAPSTVPATAGPPGRHHPAARPCSSPASRSRSTSASPVRGRGTSTRPTSSTERHPASTSTRRRGTTTTARGYTSSSGGPGTGIARASPATASASASAWETSPRVLGELSDRALASEVIQGQHGTEGVDFYAWAASYLDRLAPSTRHRATLRDPRRLPFPTILAAFRDATDAVAYGRAGGGVRSGGPGVTGPIGAQWRQP
jgi:hypothetical protein